MYHSLDAVAIFDYFLSLSKIMTISLFVVPKVGVAPPFEFPTTHCRRPKEGPERLDGTQTIASTGTYKGQAKNHAPFCHPFPLQGRAPLAGEGPELTLTRNVRLLFQRHSRRPTMSDLPPNDSIPLTCPLLRLPAEERGQILHEASHILLSQIHGITQFSQ